MCVQEKNYYVYIIASGLGGFLYTGVTSDLHQEVSQYKCLKNSKDPGWLVTRKLVYVEGPASLERATNRSFELQEMRRDARVSLIEGANIDWNDLFYDLDTYLDTRH